MPRYFMPTSVSAVLPSPRGHGELSALSSLTGGAVLGFTGQEEKNPTAAASAIPRQGGRARYNLLVGLIFGYVG